MTLPPAAVLSAPLPIPRRFGLLDVAKVTLDVDRWPASATILDYPTGDVEVQIAGASGSMRDKTYDATIDQQDVTGFTVYLGVTCTTVSAKDPDFRTRLQAAFRALEQEAVERMLVDSNGEQSEPYLTDTNMENFGAAVSATEGLAKLENAIAEVGNGMIHVTPATATALAGATLIQRRSPGILETALGTPVVVGAGYVGAYPQGGSAPSGDQEWAFASGLVEVHRDNDEILGPTIGQSMDRSTNDVSLIAERNYLLAWVGRQAPGDTDHVQAGVLIDRSA
jgi:hypothetical protein